MQKTKKSSFFNWLLPFIGPVLLIAIGILLLVNSDLLNKICIVCGSILALLGFTEIVIYSATVKYEKRPRILGTGVILLVLAAIFILIPITFDLLIPFFIGAFVLLSGIGGFVETVRITQRDTRWILAFLFDLAIIVLGAVILFYIWSGIIYQLIGILLIISGSLNVIEQILLLPAKKTRDSVIDLDPNDVKESK